MAGLPKPLRILLEEFSSAWDPASPSALERALRLAVEGNPLLMRDKSVHQEFLIELVKIDLEFRWRNAQKNGRSNAEPYLIENYFGRIPELSSLDRIPLELIKAEYGDRHSWGDSPEPDEYIRRFPQWGEELREHLEEHLLEVNMSGAKLPDIPGIVCEKLIGTGGFGLVFRAKQQDVRSRKVAVKLLRPMIDSSRGSEEKKARSRLQDEVNKLAKITHSNVIRLYDANTTSPTPYLVMEYAARGSLRELLPRLCRRLEDSDADKVKVLQQGIGRITRDVAKGLSKIHSEKLIHRDLKPENILFDDAGEAKITDFGLAQFFDEELSTQGAQGGTRPYMAPEQITTPKAIDERADIYALGVILYEMLTGERPFTLESQTLDRTRDPQSPRKLNPQVHRDLETVCLKCLEKASADRYQDAAAIVRDLELFCDGRPIITPPRTIRRRVVRFAQRHKTWLIFSVVLLVGATISFMTIDSLRRVVTGQVSDIKKHEKVTAEKTEEAKRNAKETAEANELKRLHDYAADMQEIRLKWEKNDLHGVRELLAKHDPSASGRKDIRGFEWYYWAHLLRPANLVLENQEYCRSMQVTADNSKLVCVGREHVTVWNLAMRKNIHTWTLCPSRANRFSVHDDQHYPDQSIAISPDGRLVAATGFFGSAIPPAGPMAAKGEGQRFSNLKVWEIESGREILSVSKDLQISGRAVAFSPDGTLVLAGGYFLGWKSWNLVTKKPGPASGGFSGNMQEYEEKPLPGTLNLKPEEIVKFIGFSDDGKRLFTSTTPRVQSASWSWPERRPNMSVKLGGPGLPGGIICMPGKGQGTAKIVAIDPNRKSMMVYDLPRSNKPAPYASADFQIVSIPEYGSAICAHVTGRGLIAGDENGVIHSWVFSDDLSDVKKNGLMRGHGDTITCVTLTPEWWVVSSGLNGQIRIWPERFPETIDLEAGMREDSSNDVAPLPGQRLYRVGGDDVLEIFCEKTHRLLLKVTTKKFTDQPGIGWIRKDQTAILNAPSDVLNETDGLIRSPAADERLARLRALWFRTSE